jgi:hypothetical protein
MALAIQFDLQWTESSRTYGSACRNSSYNPYSQLTTGLLECTQAPDRARALWLRRAVMRHVHVGFSVSLSAILALIGAAQLFVGLIRPAQGQTLPDFTVSEN